MSADSLRPRAVPAWWSEAKLGIFIHWTPAAVPGFAPTDESLPELLVATDPAPLARIPYTEWYQNSLRFPDSPVSRHHRSVWRNCDYRVFGADFRAGLDGWDPEEWARRFAAAGARYVVLVAKHHDGFCLWPSEVTNPNVNGWHTGRDVVGELGEAVRRQGMRYGLYYSGGFDWTFDDRPVPTLAAGAAAVPKGAYAAYAEAQVRELIDRYRPSVLWNDIAWPQGKDATLGLIADYYRAVQDGVVNDRWLPRSWVNDALRFRPLRRLADRLLRRAARHADGLVPPKPPHFDVRTPEYTSFDSVQPWPWECVRGIDHSFGFNRASQPEHFLARPALHQLVVDIVSAGGNLLLNVGPTGEATIPPEQARRLDWLGELMRDYGDVLYGTEPWSVLRATSDEGQLVRFTARGDDVYGIVLGPCGPTVTIPSIGDGVRIEVEPVTDPAAVTTFCLPSTDSGG